MISKSVSDDPREELGKDAKSSRGPKGFQEK